MKRILFILLVLAIGHPGVGQSQKRLKFLLLTGTGKLPAGHPYSAWHHDHYNHILADYVKDFADIVVTRDPSVLREDSLKKYDMIINNAMFMRPSESQLKAFFQFIESGKPFFAIHAGHLSFLNSDQYFNMIGGRFINHEDIKTFEVTTFDSWYGWEAESKRFKHPIVKDVANFKTLDELYLVQFTSPELEVIARAEYHPIMWTRNWGKGKVLCLTLGHGDFSQKNEGFQSLFVNGTKWLAGIL